MAGPEIMLPGWECQRCGHRWVSKRVKNRGIKPKVCAKCRSPYWDLPFQRVRVKAEKADKVEAVP